MTFSKVFASRQENCATAVAMSSGSGNKSASETAKSRPITARTSSGSTSGFLTLSETRRHENSVPRAFQPVGTAEIESSLLIGMFDSHPRLVSNLWSITRRNPWRNQGLRFLLRRGSGMQLPLLEARWLRCRLCQGLIADERRIGRLQVRSSVQRSRRRMPR
jgi:hypothetical protein